jgi:hypothetical protein
LLPGGGGGGFPPPPRSGELLHASVACLRRRRELSLGGEPRGCRQLGLHFWESTTATAPFAQVDDDWVLASIQIEAKLRAYFAPEIAGYWRSYSTIVESALVLLTNEYARANGGGLTKRESLDAFARLHDAKLLPANEGLQEVLWGGGDLGTLSDYREFKATLLATQEAISTRILRDDPTGYSTTWNDLLNDLVP